MSVVRFGVFCTSSTAL